ncbi:MAG: TMEM175 family protein [Thermoanaerobaculia bacterium]|nr:TMEM175 family protein [Thermoanaerobaculia bacterium]
MSGPPQIRQSLFGPYRPRRISPSRLEAFSDAVFGFSATLLVVSLEVPRTFPELLQSLEGFVAFGLSFLALILIWTTHNSFFRRYAPTDRMTMALNALLLFVVLFFVYPLKYISISFADAVLGIGDGAASVETESQLQTLFVVYGAGFVAVFLCFAMLYLNVERRLAGVLELTPLERYDARTATQFHLILAGMGLASVALAGHGIGIRFGVLSGWMYAFLGPICAAHGYWRGSRRERVARA